MERITIPFASWEWRMAAANGNATAESLAALREWTPVSAFPSVVHMELLAAGHIPDYNVGENDRLMQWAGHADWEYRVVFPTPEEAHGRKHLDLVLEGLDTFAAVSLNGVEVWRSDNMFIPVRVPVGAALKPPGETNALLIVFESAFKVGGQREESYGVRWSRMRSPKRNHTRKAQYHWGWDWGPIVLTAGPYQPVYLEAYDLRIEDVNVQTVGLDADQASAEVSVEVKATPAAEQSASVHIHVADGDGTEVYSGTTDLDETGAGHVKFSVSSPRLWWSLGLGQPHLYTVRVTLRDPRSQSLDASTRRFGIRTIELIQRPLDNEPGKTFMFRVNGVDIFSQGVNWIPAHNLLPTITRQRYFDWIRAVAFANMNMIRVWGGGIYETDDFFDACDELGVLVWHDYAFACGDYPLHDEFLASVKEEAEVQTVRIRSRASLALLCGGNEDFMMYDWLKRGPDYDHDDLVGPFDDQPFPQRKIFLTLLPEVAGRLCPSVSYWPSSPWGGSQVNDLTVGDIHQWEIWHVSQLPYQDYKHVGGRFVSEFGMQSLPVGRTVELFLRGTAPTERHPFSRAVDGHNKGRGSHLRLARYLAENFRVDTGSLPTYAYATQLLQAEAYAAALRGWKRRFAGPGAEACAGALIWQLNDVYPATSWALVDCFVRPKPAYYAVRRACAAVALGVERTPASRFVDEYAPPPRPSDVPSWTLFAHNTGRRDVAAALVLRAYDMAAGVWTALSEAEARRDVTLLAGVNSELGALAAHEVWAEDSLVVLEATLVGPGGETLSRTVDWPEPFRYLHWPRDTRLSVRVEAVADDGGDEKWEHRVTVVANQPLKGVWLEPVYDGSEKDDDPEPLWEDNMVDLMPDSELSFRVKGLKGRQVGARFLADWEVGQDKS